MRKFMITALLAAGAITATAQNFPADFATRRIETTLQQYLQTNNAAGMGLYQPSNGSKTQIEGFWSGGDDHLTQQGAANYGFDFSTLRYDSFSDKLFMRGSFHYSLSREKDRVWSDVMDPWFSSPFIYGSTVAKDYEKHDCGLTFDLYTAPLAGWVSVGVRAKYDVADHSGLRDPRPRTNYLDWQAVPSVLFTIGHHHIGLDFGYGYSKEKLTGLTTIQDYPNLYYYKMSGLDHVDGAIGAYSGFKRQFYGGRFVGDLSYNYVSGHFKALVSAGVEYKKLDTYGDNKQSPGSYNHLLYNVIANLQYRHGKLLHVLQFTGSMKDAGADEYLQELLNEKNPETGVTTQTWITLYEYKNRYMLKQTEAQLKYTLFGGCVGTDYRWSVEAAAAYSAFQKECFLPYSEFSVKRLEFSLCGSVRIFDVHNHRLEASALAGGIVPLKVSQGFMYDNIYTAEVLEPDGVYYRRQRVGANASITWLFPMNLGKAGMARGYLRLEGGYRKALQDGSLANAAVTIGLFTF